ncbi:hypothetical protein T265_00582 [Opisthorchis viverrini]|uniref:Uncharacterized protein n=1 Tax=Opisthorchis viverrini TaxID=6198 RepID=A0A075AC60_OPIVI|nr:hypothetical protein T265_00582 [Opisthorchis viverrini]KER33465.1 hypothetical protein T265_00582 [Opisthorchis viverrini]
MRDSAGFKEENTPQMALVSIRTTEEKQVAWEHVTFTSRINSELTTEALCDNFVTSFIGLLANRACESSGNILICKSIWFSRETQLNLSFMIFYN